MTRTRLRGMEIGGIALAVEVPESCPWTWPDAPISDYACPPRDPEVHVGVRVAAVPQYAIGGERYDVGGWVFEVARRGEDWLLGLERAGRREQLAHFDPELCQGEIVISREYRDESGFPLRSPLDEWIVVHRTVAHGGLCLRGTAHAVGGRASLRLGTAPRFTSPLARVASGARPGSQVSAQPQRRPTVLLREQGGVLRAYRTPWSDAIDRRLPRITPVCDLTFFEEADRPYREPLDPEEGADYLATHAVVTLSDEDFFDRVLQNARRLAARIDLHREGMVPWLPGVEEPAVRSATPSTPRLASARSASSTA